jgi:DNA-binding MarR family transcriptional regulator/N-acetylglutamate synthase-like GNAT family acetyltransferase
MAVASRQISAVRAFNRDYTRRIGVLGQGMLDSPYSLTQARVLYEIEHRPGVTATALATDLRLDAGYLSRIVRGFESRGLLRRERADQDARNQYLRLTAAGRRAYRPLERGSQEQVRDMLAQLDEPRRTEVVAAMRSIREAFAPPVRPLRLRAPAPGDLGWVVERHGALYAREFRWGAGFEGLVAGIVADFDRASDPARERCWIATQAGRRLGCVFVVRDDDATARLRLLLVESQARGLGLGRRLVAECLGFARAAGYQRMVLWTHRNLSAARHLYAQAGFRLMQSEPRHSFGQDVVSEIWEIPL